MIRTDTNNVDVKTARGFGEEWSTFRQSEHDLSPEERECIFQGYFQVFPWELLPTDAVGIDVGCGSGRWSKIVASRIGHLHVMDVSLDALNVARENLADHSNVSFHIASVGEMPVPPQSMDFAFSLGVLHHVPDTRRAIQSVAGVLKSGAPFLIYLYYAFDNRPWWFRLIWMASNAVRVVASRLPHGLRYSLSQILAILVYWPLARFAAMLESFGLNPETVPLSWYRDRSFYVMRTDAYDRFCTRLEQRFTRAEIENMLLAAGFGDIRFSDKAPFWCAVGLKR